MVQAVAICRRLERHAAAFAAARARLSAGSSSEISTAISRTKTSSSVRVNPLDRAALIFRDPLVMARVLLRYE
jgi:hypothetical protein